MTRIFLIILSTLILGYSAASYAHKDATGIVKERMDLFKKSQQDIKALYSSIKSGEIEKIKISSSELADWGAAIPEYFPLGSGGGVSDASEKIWDDFESFEESAKALELAALSVLEAANRNDMEAIIAAAKSVGNSCKSCHRNFKK